MNKGFSLVELIVVIAIMAILVGVAVPVYTQYIGNANKGVDEQTAGEIEHAIEVVLIDPTVTDTPDGTVVVLTASGLAYEEDAQGAAVAEDDFLKAVKGIVPSATLKHYEKVTFTIDGYSCTVTYPAKTNG